MTDDRPQAKGEAAVSLSSAARLAPSGKLAVRRVIGIWDRIEQTLAGLLGLAALTFGLWQVLGRYFFPAEAISYAEEVIVYLVIWGVMLISSELVSLDGHVRSDLVLRLIPPQALRWVEVGNCVVALIFTGGLVWYGWQVVDTSVVIDEHSSTDLQFPMWLYYLALPVGGGLMFVRYVLRFVRYTFLPDAAMLHIGPAAHELPLEAGAGPPIGA